MIVTSNTSNSNQKQMALVNQQKTKRIKKREKISFDITKFKYELTGCIQLESDEDKQNESSNFQRVGLPWSGLYKIRMHGKIKSFLFGTDNGKVVKVEFIEQCKHSTDSIQEEENRSVQQLEQIYENSELDIDASMASINVQIYKILNEKQVCSQVGQIGDYLFVSSKDGEKNTLKLFDMKNQNKVDQISGSLSSYYFVKAENGMIIYRYISVNDQLPSIIFSKVSEGKFHTIRTIQLLNFEQLPTSLNAISQYLFVGLYTKQVLLYHINTGKLLKSFSSEITSYPKKLVVSPDYQILSIISVKDEIVFMNIITGNKEKSFSLPEIFEKAGIIFDPKFQIYLSQFLDQNIITIGGSFDFLFFIDWRTFQIVNIYQDESQFVGMLIKNNQIYITHEKDTKISILE